MENKNTWIIGGVVILVIAVLVITVSLWYFNQANKPLVSRTVQPPIQQNIGIGTQITNNRPAQSPQVAPTSNVALEGNIDANSLNASSPTPTITGSYKGDTAVEIVIVEGRQTLPKDGNSSNIQNVVVVGYSDHGGDVKIDSHSLASGKFSYEVSTPLMAGVYTVGVYLYHNIYDNRGYQGNSSPQLATSGRLLVH